MNQPGTKNDETAIKAAASSSSSSSDLLLSALIRQARELRSFTGSRVLRIPCNGNGGGGGAEGSGGPDPELFLRAAVAPRRPCLLEGAGNSFSPPAPWSEERFLELAGGAETAVTVAETPHGRADAVVPFSDGSGGRGGGGSGGSGGRVFAQPREMKMELGELLRSLHAEAAETAGSSSSSSPPSPPGGGVVRYAQRQNDSAAEEFAALLDGGAVPRRLPWAERAFLGEEESPSPRGGPDAVNVWVGGPRSATAWHRDHYENVHFCLVGQKEFHLLPPGEGWRLQRRRWRAARYEEEGESGRLVPVLESPPRTVRWSAAPPPPPPPPPPADRSSSEEGEDGSVDLPQDAFPWLLGPEARGARLPPPLTVVVEAGDAIYLPPLWWHCVTQRGSGGGGGGESPPPPPRVTVCVNYWYDMRFDDRWCAARLADRLERSLLRLGGEGEGGSGGRRDDDDESESESESESDDEEESDKGG